jgi:hypothetical protein
VSELRHHKTGRQIGNKPICTDEFGTLWFRCQYTKKLVACDVGIMLGAVIPQVAQTFVCAPDALEAFRANKRAFDELDANCNACANFVRVKHEKNPNGFLRGTCGIGILPEFNVYSIEDNVYWIHPDDSMNMRCWKAREKNERVQDRAADPGKRPPDGDLRAGKKAQTNPQRAKDDHRKHDPEPAQAVRGSGDMPRGRAQKTTVLTLDEVKGWLRVLGDRYIGVPIPTTQEFNWEGDGLHPGVPASVLLAALEALQTPEAMWDRFMDHLNTSQPLLPKYKVEKGMRVIVESSPHKAFLGSVEHYQKKFLETNNG